MTLLPGQTASAALHPVTAAARARELPPRLAFLDRDHSLIAFNERVLDLARRAEVPLLERLRFLCIVSSNLDEFFEVRARAGDAGADEGLERLAAAVHRLVRNQYAVYNDELMPALRRRGIAIVSHSERTPAQRRWVQDYFAREVRPLLVPVGLDPAHPFPQVANKSLNFIVRLDGRDAFGRENEVAIVKVPRVLARVIRMPPRVSGGKALFVLLSSVIRASLGTLFPGRRIVEFSQFRVTRHSDLAVDEDEVRDLRSALRIGLRHRHYGEAVRLEVSAGCSEPLAAFLLEQFGLSPAALYRVHGPVNLVRLQGLLAMVDAPRLVFPPYRPPPAAAGGPWFERLRRGDVLLHLPFERFDAVTGFLREAVDDPQVLAIRLTIYRAGSDPVMLDLLREAVSRGKEVTAVVELKARFDEEANIDWTEKLESVGAQVVYGVVGLKTHAKMLLVTRREGRALRRYAHLSTGNYNPATAKQYTDIGYFTADAQLTRDVEHLFVHLASQSRLPRLARAWVAPFQLQRRLIDKVDEVADAARSGRPARIVLKMNALTDEPLMLALVRASQAGAKIDLVVRGACMLPAQVPGVTGNVRVRSVVGRFLEHTRIFYFRRGDEEDVFLSSADWMNRNMLRRVELAWPVADPLLRRRIVDECLVPYLQDRLDAWDMRPDGTYVRVDAHAKHKGPGAQAALMALHGDVAPKKRLRPA
ncbi:polyphosphate kinase 1 [Ramlibacter albus]|uniref:Polyphosphate kinase n=1 Tax=Ramlibacter albus TaxID=2079448 RepID=A0A923MBS1_9BURK|nr:polyphosphate kinase 1 [Ramlibacter albus]MBC5766616.1 polyphosphate kinase 1 [Ramlibacter albus]